MPDLPEFPPGIDTRLQRAQPKVLPLRRVKKPRPPDARRTFLWVFAAFILLVFFSPLIADLLRR